MAFIDGDCSLKLLYIFFYITLGTILRKISFLKEVDFNNIYSLNATLIISFLQTLFYFLDNIRKKKTIDKELEESKKKEKEKKLVNLNENIIKTLSNKERKTKLKLFFFLIICGISEAIRLLYKLFLNEGKKDISYFISGPLLLVIMILSYFILNVKSYQHHYFCLICMFIGDILMGYNNGKENNIIKGILNNYKNNIFDFFFSAPKICIEKYMMHYLYANPYLIIYFEGIIQIIVILFVYSGYIIYIICNNKENQYIFDQVFFIKEILNHWLIIPVFFLILVILKFLELRINEKFGPTYLVVASTCFIYYKFYDVISGNSKLTNNIQKIYYIIYAIIPFFFCEIIILNFLGFGKNTRKIISERERRELKKLEEDIQNFELSINLV